MDPEYRVVIAERESHQPRLRRARPWAVSFGVENIDQVVLLGVENEQRVLVARQLLLAIELALNFSNHIAFGDARRRQIRIIQKTFGWVGDVALEDQTG